MSIAATNHSRVETDDGIRNFHHREREQRVGNSEVARDNRVSKGTRTRNDVVSKEDRVALADSVGAGDGNHIAAGKIERVERIAALGRLMAVDIHARLGADHPLEEDRIAIIDRVIERKVIVRVDNQVKGNRTIATCLGEQIANVSNCVNIVIVDNGVAPSVAILKNIATKRIVDVDIINRQ